MTQIVGTLRNSKGDLLNGRLRVTLDATVVDEAPEPDSIYLPEPAIIPITNGAINFAIPQSETEATSYHFKVEVDDTSLEYYLADGERYEGPKHQHNGAWYTELLHTTNSVPLAQQTRSDTRVIQEFHAIVPNASQVEFTRLLPSGVSNDLLDTSIRRLAQVLTSNPLYAAILRGGPNPKGAYNANTYYRQDDWVSYDGSSYVYTHEVPANNILPTTTTHWQLNAAKGDSGTGTSGNNQPYTAGGWLNQLDAPSRNAVRNVIQTLATNTALEAKANKISPKLEGIPETTLPSPSDDSLRIVPSVWVNDLFARVSGAEFTGPVAVPTVSQASNSLAATNTAWVTSKLTNYPTTAEAHPRGGAANLSLSASQLILGSGTPLGTFAEETVSPGLTLGNLMEATFTYSARYGKVLRLGRCIMFTARVRTSQFTKNNGSGQVYIDTAFNNPLSVAMRVPIIIVIAGSLPANTISTFGTWSAGLPLIGIECGLSTAQAVDYDANQLSPTLNEFFLQVMLPNY